MPLTPEEFETVVKAVEERVIKRLRAASLVSQQRQDAVLAALTDAPASVRDLADGTGISKSAVHRRLAALIEAGLAAKQSGGYIATGYEPPDPFEPNGSARCEHCTRALRAFGTHGYLCPCDCEDARKAQRLELVTA